MHDSDIRVVECTAEFRPVRLEPPLTLSRGSIDYFTVCDIRLVAADRSGRSAAGAGSTILSVPWAWPHPDLSIEDRDGAMRRLCRASAESVIGAPAADPVQWWRDLEATLPPESAMPRLAGLLCLGALDSALHDAWSRVAGQPAYAMYDADHLTDDLRILGRELTGRYPGEFLNGSRSTLPVQHLVSTQDPLTDAEADGATRSLQDWIRTDRIRHLKLKLGHEPVADAHRTAAVHRAAVECIGAVTIAVDPNEAYTSVGQVAEFLQVLRRDHPDAAAALSYIEQPVPRGTDLATSEDPIPILMDEGLTSVAALRGLPGSGWGGIVVKAAKGQTHGLLAHSYARFHDLYLTVQDLTAVDRAFRHSVRLASVLQLSAVHLEYNSRQYAAHANSDLTRSHPEMTTVRDGAIRIEPVFAPGIY
ncbi:MAG TPA: enolase C-terminal domain-like protein [Mycobacteriales bacterium]|nr:enolase C-terminal domain-like protein [Mycobacteriales bacterium]